jgi:signal transduction histidine kinase
LERLRRLQMYSAMIVPLVARGNTLGAITLVLHGPGRRSPFDATDLALATELARRAALALDNSRLYSAERAARAESERAAELTRRLQEVTASFARTLTLEDVAATTLSHGIDALSAHSGVVYTMNSDGDALELVARRGVADEVVRSYVQVPLSAHTPATDAVRTGEMVLLEGRAEMRARYPQFHELERYAMSEGWVAIPLVYGARTLGAVALGFAELGAFTVEQRALLDALGRHCSQAMERARLLQAEREARTDAVRANRAKSELLAKVSHETRQPLHATIGWIETMELGLHGELSGPQRDALRRVKQNQQRLLEVINDLLDMSRIEAGKLDVRMGDVSIVEVVDEVESAVGPQLREKGIRLELCLPSPGVTVRADRVQVAGILTNLLNNAAKFTAVDGHVSVSCAMDERDVRLTVGDSGIGIPAEYLERVFEPFFQVDAGFTRTTVGTGLGLAIAREAARAMGGDVTVESEVGVGSRFTLSLRRTGEPI